MRKLVSLVCMGIMLLAGFTGCGETKPTERPSATSSQRYELRGAVISVDAPTKEVIVQHEKIADLMDAMRMSFSVPNPEDLAKLQPGKSFKATLVVENNMMWIERVEITGDAPTLTTPEAAAGASSH